MVKYRKLFIKRGGKNDMVASFREYIEEKYYDNIYKKVGLKGAKCKNFYPKY